MLRRRVTDQCGQRGWRPTVKRRFPLRTCMIAAAAVVIIAVAGASKSSAPAKKQVYAVSAAPAVEKKVFTLPANVRQGFAEGETGYTITMSEKRLMAGRMLLVDEAHPLPEAFTPPGSYGILHRTNGRVACRDAQATLAADALDALDEMFRHARYARHNNMVVFAASRSEEQQRNDLMDRMSALSRSMSFEAALAQAKQEIEMPGCSEHQLPWCVDIRLCTRWNALPDHTALQDSEAGRWLLAHCWEYGFIHRYPEAGVDSHRAWHFRYVGKGHAAMMRALSVSLEEYLSLMRTYGVLTLMNDAGKPSVTVLCQPMGEGEQRFTLPLHGTVEDASADNDGWAVVSCVYQ